MKANWSKLEIPLTILAGMLVVYVTVDALNLRFNFTPSEPVGIYKMEPASTDVHRGDLVEFCYKGQSNEFMFPGGCQNGKAPFLKTVAAVSGDLVVVGDAGVMVNGVMLPNSRPALHSFSDPSLKLPVLRGRFQLNKGQFWAYGSGDSEHSFDSRYYGAIDEKDIMSVAKRGE